MLLEHFFPPSCTHEVPVILGNYWLRGCLYLGLTALCMFEAATMSSGLCLFCGAVTYLRAAINGEKIERAGLTGLRHLQGRSLSTHAQYSIAASGSYSGKLLSLGIRREDKNRWERRVPLVPDHVERLVKELGVKVYVQPSTKRVIPDDKYAEVGAEIREDLSEADIIVGVKEVPTDKLYPDKTFLYFSHTYKGQRYNMPMLKAILDKRIRLIDYELMKDDNNRRLVLFSKFAGYAGFLDGVNGLGHRLLALGYGNPFLACGLSYMYRCLADARLDLTRTGQVIMDDGLPRALGPLVFVFTGDGNVTRGALHVFKCLPHEWVKPEDLRALVENKDFDNHKVYGCKVKIEDYIVKKDGGPFSRQEYLENPSLYESVFHEKIAPYASMLVNGIFWDERYPRLLTKEQAKTLVHENRFRMLQVADISCDIHGSLEFMSRATTIDQPFFMYDPATETEHNDTEGKGVQIMSIDNLPTEMPLEASEYFGDALFPFILELVKGNFNHPVLKRATITTNTGKLESGHEKLYPIIEEYGVPQGSSIKVTARKNVLLLGSGYVSAPLVDYLLRSKDVHVTVASNAKAEAERLKGGRSAVTVAPLDVSDGKALKALVQSSDAVVSFVPASLHPIVAEQCIEEKKNMITASYISPAMQALDERAKAKGITILNEIGLDPGIDHLTAMKLFDEVKEKGGEITSFVSWCGGLPAPEASANPLGYKFSWSPKGVLLAGLNSAKYKEGGKNVEIPGSQLMRSARPVNIYPGFALEGLPNRDSLSYLDTYNLRGSKYLETMFRGTLRYKGYAELMAGFIDLGLLDTTPVDISSRTTWATLLAKAMKLPTVPKGSKAWHEAVQYKLSHHGKAAVSRIVSALEWMDLTSEHHNVHPSPSILDAFCALLQAKLVYLKNERDMVIMHHEFGIRWGENTKERRTSTLIAYGDPQGYSAMAKTVGLPAAVATEMIIRGQVPRVGVLAPVYKDLYEPLLEKLENEGIRFEESSFTDTNSGL
ncbi:hypothetical protein HDU96_010059 [Phlyctochytrium bullatum]|nr:hypothetical protein HDU96_010059 [Phlyctochytrium bullatum]